MSQPLPLLHLHHIARMTRDPDASKAFYCDILGFQELPRPEFRFRGAWLLGYGFQIHIIENQEVDPIQVEGISTRTDHLAFATADIEIVKANLSARGCEFHEQVNAGKAHQVFFRDPDGHHIEVAQYPNADPTKGHGQ